MLYDFLTDIRKLRYKKQRVKAILEATPTQRLILNYITTNSNITKDGFYKIIKEENVADKVFSTDMLEIMQEINDGLFYTQEEIMSAIFWSLNNVEQFMGPKEAKQAAKVFFREVDIGLTAEEVQNLLKR